MAHSSLNSEKSVFGKCLFLKLFAVIFANFFPYSINYVIKTKYILQELKTPWHINAISKTYNCGYNIMEFADILPNVSFSTSETELDYYQ